MLRVPRVCELQSGQTKCAARIETAEGSAERSWQRMRRAAREFIAVRTDGAQKFVPCFRLRKAEVIFVRRPRGARRSMKVCSLRVAHTFFGLYEKKARETTVDTTEIFRFC